MEYLYETIEHSNRLPIKIFTHTISNFPYHWHEDVEILFVLKGDVELTVDNTKYLYKEGNVFIINSNDLHSIVSKSADNRSSLLALQFNLNHFKNYNISAGMRFKIEYAKKGSIKRDAYNNLRLILATMMRSVINKEEPQQLIIERYLFDLLIVLINNFQANDTNEEDGQSDQKRTIQIIKYINANCIDRDIGLETVAEYFHLNPQYLSRYFKSNVGIPFKKFIDNMRLNKSLEVLKYTDQRIMDIALSYGFADAKAYYRVFRDTYGVTPAEYREQHKIDMDANLPKSYFGINKREMLSKLFEYLKYNHLQQSEAQHISKEIKVNLNAGIGKFINTAMKLTTFGYAPHGLREDFAKQLKMLQSDIGFEYIRFHGIFADELLAYNEKPDGEIYYNFNHTDKLIDLLLENNIKPFLELGFMPKDLTSTDASIFWWNCNVSPPNDINKWLDFLEAFIRHLINRYGIDEVLTWYFEFWNEPEIEGVFFDGNVRTFYEFFKESFLRIKSIDSRIKAGGFGTNEFLSSNKWIRDIASYANNDNIKLDFMTFHVYQTTIGESGSFSIEALGGMRNEMFENENVFTEMGAALGGAEYITEAFDSRVETIKSLNMSEEEMFVTEFNSNPDGRDLVHDTCYTAAYIVKNVLENMNKVAGIGYWTFTDIFEEFRLPQPLFHGGFGLITYNGIKKASYNAYVFLGRLGDELIYKGEDIIITKKADDYQMLAYNYCHYNELYSSFDYSQISVKERYGVFEKQANKNIKLKLSGIKGRYFIEKHRVNKKNGSSFDAWVDIGAPEHLSKEAYEYLQAAAVPGYTCRSEDIVNGFEMTIELEPHEIQLIILKRQY